MNEANYALGLGSNIGNGVKILHQAINELAHSDINVIARSSFYSSPAWGYEDQAHFTNACLLIHSKKSPRDMLKAVKSIENNMGRKPSWRWGPRLIDIDLLWWRDGAFQDDHLTLPHPSMLERPFVIVPLAEIAPNVLINNLKAKTIASTIDKNELSIILTSDI